MQQENQALMQYAYLNTTGELIGTTGFPRMGTDVVLLLIICLTQLCDYARAKQSLS
jgi:hypothetical protein